jgi:hypothetical protein
MADKRSEERKGHWPFDPMQPGDHEPVRLPEELEHLRNEESPPPERKRPKEQQ